MNKVNIILDCDTKNEADDQFAIVYALKSPEINLLGVVSVQNTKKHGFKSVDKYHNEAKNIIKLCDSKVPAFKGSRYPLKSLNEPERSEGVNFIINTALNSKDKILIVGTGPCTDLVNACLIEPKIRKKCGFIWLGGFRSNKEINEFKSKECNFDGDKFATKILMNLEIDLILLPAWGVTDRMISQCDSIIELLEKRNLPITKYLSKLIKAEKQRFKIFWDIAAPAVAKNFGIISKRRVPACKANNGKLYFPAENKKKITIVYSINELEIFKQAKEYIAN